MIISVENLKKQVDCGDMTDEVIALKMGAIEEIIRKYTHNNFQNRRVRFSARSFRDTLQNSSPFLEIGDTIQISQTTANNGIYTVLNKTDENITVNAMLFEDVNLITKVEYPADVVECAVDLFKWKKEFGSKVGIKSESETLSRHSTSVTYEDSTQLYMGYPIGILQGLRHHRKVRC